MRDASSWSTLIEERLENEGERGEDTFESENSASLRATLLATNVRKSERVRVRACVSACARTFMSLLHGQCERERELDKSVDTGNL